MRDLTLILSSLFIASSASAQYLVDPAFGVELSTPGENNSLYRARELGFTGRHFGRETTTVNVSTNGYLVLDDFATDNNAPFAPSAHAMIAPLSDNLYVYPESVIVENVLPGVYYAVTWEVGSYTFGHIQHAFQVVWFGATTTLHGVEFNAGDIAFCYKRIGSPTPAWDATVGMCAGNSTLYTTIPGNTNGMFSGAALRSAVPEFGENARFVLFRPAGDYYATFLMGAAPAAEPPACPVDFNHDGFLDFFDYDDFVQAFEQGC